MNDEGLDAGRLAREVAYYRRNLDSLAGENLRIDASLRAHRHRLRQKEQALVLLADLYQSIGAQTPPSAVFGIVVAALNRALSMDRSVVLVPASPERTARPAQWAGFGQAASARLRSLSVELPPDVAKGTARLVVNRASEKKPLESALASAFDVPYFVWVPVIVDVTPIAFLFCGRRSENAVLLPALDEGEADTLEAVAALVSSAILRGRLAALEESDRLRAAFFANVSQELRTPITVSLGQLEQVLSSRLGPVALEMSESLRVVQRNQELLLDLVDQVLELARLESGEVRLRVAAVPDFNGFVAQHARPFRTLAEARGLELRLALDPRLDGADLYIDRHHVERVLVNLLSNALKFTDRGSITVTTEVGDGECFLTVADTGTGIVENELPYLFDRLRLVTRGKGDSPGGIGIGLAFVKEVVSRHGGDVAVQSEPGRGSTFRLRFPRGTGALDPSAVLDLEEAPAPAGSPRLPAADVAGADDVEAANRTTESAFDSGKPVVLYVEDNREMRKLVQSFLGQEANVFVAPNGRKGLELAHRYRPDAIVTDHMMPEMSGGELLAAIREDPELASTPVLLLTALASTEARIESLEAGADDFLTKPFHHGELRARVRNLVRARAQEKELAELNRRLEAKLADQVTELVRTGELKRFLPSPVVERLLSGQLEASGSFERRKVTVLIADAAGFADLADRLEPEELSAILSGYLDEMSRLAAEHGGTVETFVGDGLMVIFGAPQPVDDDQHAWSAVQAALAMRSRVADLAAQARRRGLPADLQVRIGMNTGYCTVGVFGRELLRSYTAAGLPVNVAARLHDEAEPGAILCGLSTYTLVGERATAVPHELKASSGGPRLEAFEILGPADAGAPQSVVAPPGPPATAASLAAAGAAAAPADRLFRREGDYWTISFQGAVFRLKDTKGLAFLAFLLARPHREVHVVDLLSALEGAPATSGYRTMNEPQLAAVGLHSDDGGDAGVILDVKAKAAYKRRLEELGEELEEARQFNDLERAARAQAEIDALMEALAAAVGLGGRDRRAASRTERARLNVTRAIRSAVDKISQNNPELGQHLAVSVRTGTYCSYAPDPGVPAHWVL